MVELTRSRAVRRWWTALAVPLALVACSDADSTEQAATSATAAQPPTTTASTTTTTTQPPATSPEVVPVILALLDRYEALEQQVALDPPTEPVPLDHPWRLSLQEIYTPDSPLHEAAGVGLDADPPVSLAVAGEYGTVLYDLRLVDVATAPDPDTFLGGLCAYTDWESVDPLTGETVTTYETQGYWYTAPLEAHRVDGVWRIYDARQQSPADEHVGPPGPNPCPPEVSV